MDFRANSVRLAYIHTFFQWKENSGMNFFLNNIDHHKEKSLLNMSRLLNQKSPANKDQFVLWLTQQTFLQGGRSTTKMILKKWGMCNQGKFSAFINSWWFVILTLLTFCYKVKFV